MNRIILLVLILSGILYLDSESQVLNDDSTSIKDFEVLMQMIKDGDTLLHSTIKEVEIYPVPRFDRRRDLRRYERLVYNLKIVYPYAILAGEKLNELNGVFVSLKSERERKEFVKQVEKELMNEFEDDLKSLTITQGRLLIKLIDRETGSTSYELVRELRGSFSAFFWQTIARIFGSNLKTQFDPEGEDKLIEQILHMIDNGQI
ncbi:MAG: DUF4294 domain-containing protein [Bacteroidales bacterium]